MEAQKDNVRMNSLSQELMDQYRMWDNVLVHGSANLCYEDGVILHQIRSRIILLKRKMELLYPLNRKPSIYYSELPPVVRKRYMARSEKIRRNAGRTLWILKNNKEYLYLSNNFPLLAGDVHAKEICMKSMIDQTECLSDALDKDDLLTLCMYENANLMIENQKTAMRQFQRLYVCTVKAAVTK